MNNCHLTCLEALVQVAGKENAIFTAVKFIFLYIKFSGGNIDSI